MRFRSPTPGGRLGVSEAGGRAIRGGIDTVGVPTARPLLYGVLHEVLHEVLYEEAHNGQ